MPGVIYGNYPLYRNALQCFFTHIMFEIRDTRKSAIFLWPDFCLVCFHNGIDMYFGKNTDPF